MTIIHIAPLTPGGLKVSFRYDPTVVALLKDVVPGHERGYDPLTKVWTIHSSTYAALFLARARAAGHSLVGDTGAELPPPRPAGSAMATWAGSLFDAVGPELLKPTYRAMCRVLHPDAGGDTRLFDQLTKAYETRTAA